MHGAPVAALRPAIDRLVNKSESEIMLHDRKSTRANQQMIKCHDSQKNAGE